MNNEPRYQKVSQAQRHIRLGLTENFHSIPDDHKFWDRLAAALCIRLQPPDAVKKQQVEDDEE